MRFALFGSLCLALCACSGCSESTGEKVTTSPSEKTGEKASEEPGDKVIADASKTLQGKWYNAGWEDRGNKTNGEGPEGTVYTFSDGQYRYEPKGLAPQEGTWKITGRKGTVFDIDQTLTTGINKGLTLTGILEIVDNDTVRLCVPFYTSKPMVRPQKFESKINDQHAVFLLKRRK